MGRFLNLVLAKSDGPVVSSTDLLEPGGRYQLRLDVGAARPESVIENAVDHRLPDLPKTHAGHWIDVIADADGFEVSPRNSRLFLPAHGQSTALQMDVMLPRRAEPRDAAHCALLERSPASNSANARPLGHSGARPVALGPDDYSLTDLADVARLPERDFSLLLNDSGDGRHRLIVNQRDDDPYAVRPFEAEMSQSLKTIRSELLRAHRAHDGRYSLRRVEREGVGSVLRGSPPPGDRWRPPARHGMASLSASGCDQASSRPPTRGRARSASRSSRPAVTSCYSLGTLSTTFLTKRSRR